MTSSDLISDGYLRAGQWRHQLAETVASVRVLVVGDVMLDRYWFGDVSRISPEAPVPVVQIRNSDDRLGGAANVARNVVSLGAQATLVGIVGADEAAECLQALLVRERITARLQVDPAVSTTVKLRVLSQRQQMLRIDFDASANKTAPLNDDQLLPLLASHDAVVFSDYAKGCITAPGTWIAAARHLGLHVIVDPKASDFSRYAGSSVLKPNLAEFIRAAGLPADEDELAEKAQSLRRSLNVESLLLTRSEQGMSLFDSRGEHHFPAQVREVFDVCGAGDTAGAVMATLLAAGIDLRLSAWLANRAAGIAVSRTGTAAVTMNELVNSLQ